MIANLLTMLKGRWGQSVADVTALTLGTIASRLINAVTIPVIACLYQPSDFATLAVYVGIVNTLSIAACLRLDVAISLADSDTDARALVILSTAALLCTTLLLATAHVFVTQLSLPLLNSKGLSHYAWVIPLGVAMVGLSSIMRYWLARKRQFPILARARLSQSLMSSLVVLGFGAFAAGPAGLVIGSLVEGAIAGPALFLTTNGPIRPAIKAFRWAIASRVLKQYSNYPLYSAPDALLNVAGMQLPIVLIAGSDSSAAGSLYLATQIMTVPMALLGSSIGLVYMSRAPEHYKAGRLAGLTFVTIKRLASFSAIPLAAVSAIAPIAVPFVLGDNWALTGRYIAYMCPWICLQLLASPISMVMYLTGYTWLMLVVATIGLVSRVGLVLFAQTAAGWDPVLALVVGNTFFYGLVLAASCWAATISGHAFRPKLLQ